MGTKTTVEIGNIRGLFKGYVHNANKAAFKLSDSYLTRLKQDRFMPRNDGNMQENNTFIEPGAYRKDQGYYDVVTEADQARRLYYHPEYNFQKGHNPNAGGLWIERHLEHIGGEEQLFKDFLSFLEVD